MTKLCRATPKIVDEFNQQYSLHGFHGVLSLVEDMLEYGRVKKMDDCLWRITTAGYSDDEEICQNLRHILCRFGYLHYVGSLRGGAYYFSEVKHDENIAIVRLKE